MKKLLFALFLFFSILSCKDPVKTSAPAFDKIEVDKKIYASNDSTKPYMKLSLAFTYPSTFKNDTLLFSLQKIFVEAFIGDEYISKSPKGAFDAYEKEFTEDALLLAQDMGDDLGLYGECFQNIKTELVDTTENLLVVRTTIESYMGGAHGSHNLNYKNIDINSVSVLTEKDIFLNYSESEIASFIIEALKQKYADKVNDILFDVDAVLPNGNFFFDKTGLLYVYNEYEIAPYSSGVITVTLPYEKINSLIKEEYRKK